MLPLSIWEVSGPHVKHHTSPIIERNRSARVRLSLRVAGREGVLFKVKLFRTHQRDGFWKRSGAKAIRLRRHTIQVCIPGVSTSVC